jgi:hypothetical protein
VAATLLGFFLKKYINFNIFFLLITVDGILVFKSKLTVKKWHIPSKLTGFPDEMGQSI